MVPFAKPHAKPSPELAYAAFVMGTSLSQILGLILPEIPGKKKKKKERRVKKKRKEYEEN